MHGQQFIQSQLNNIPQTPGVYQMLDQQKNILYIGKAKNLKKRVSNYAKLDLPARIARMVFCACELKIIQTNSEAEALLLEATLIKKIKPKFNILLKDDKSFAYIKISKQEWPQISKFRGKVLQGASFFGPFVSSRQVDVAINEIQKIFKIRSCSDTFFATRKRPCLLYQIQKCSAPCVGKLSQPEYLQLVEQANYFLSGKSKKLLQILKEQMCQYSENFEYEKAASVRDRLKAVEAIQTRNLMNLRSLSNVDVIGIDIVQKIACVQIFLYRGGQNFGHNSYFPANCENAEKTEVLMSFLGQFYQSKKPPEKILLNLDIGDQAQVLQEALFKLHEVKVKIDVPKTQEQHQLIQMVENNISGALEVRANKAADIAERLSMIGQIFTLAQMPKRIEVYDNSHIMGQHAVGAMIVAGLNGFEKNEYRKFNIRTNTNTFGGNDYQMLREVLTRRFAKLDEFNKPDLIIVDGGKGHLSVVEEVMSHMGLRLPYVCMSKGPERNKGGEYFHMPDRQALTMPNSDKAMQYLQMLRDEAHNFAISSHRIRRSKLT